MKYLFCLLLMSLSTWSYADKDDLNTLQKQQNEWFIVKHDNSRQITTYAKNEEGKKIRSFKVEAVVDASLPTLARIHFDVANLKKWYWEALDSKLLSKVSDTEYVYYMRFQAPLTTDRDVVIHAKVEPYQDVVHPYMRLSLKSAASALPVPQNMTRIAAFDVDIKFTPLRDGKTQMEVEGLVDPAGDLPVWTVNMVQRQAPYATMLGLYRMIQKPEYKQLNDPLAFKYAQK